MKLNNRLLIGAGLLLVLVIIGVSTFLLKNLNTAYVTAMNYDFTVVAEIDDSSGVDVNSGFIITSNEDYSLDIVKDIIKLEPQIDYDITKTGSGSYYLKTKTALNDNTIYNIHALNENEPDVSWAFQTKADFKVTSTLPANKSTNVPINTGIEMIFSKTPTDIQEYFSISPSVKGKFEIIGKKICFIPSSSLAYDTEYTIKIAKDFKAIDGSTLNDECVYKFTTTSNSKRISSNIYIYDELNETFSSKDTQLIGMYASKGDFSNEKFYVNIYDLKTPEEYVEQIKSIEKGFIDTNKFDKISTFETNLVSQSEENYYDRWYIVFPENLPAGWYLADITTGMGIGDTKNQHLQKLIQVTDISVYAQSYNTETVVWCNDVATGLPLANANITIKNVKETTNANGVAILYIDEDEKTPMFITAPDGRKFAETLYLSDKETYTVNDMYYLYFYTDREVYLPTDTINYWGVILPKKSNSVVPKTVELEWEGSEEKTTLFVGTNGSFSGKLEFSKLISSYYSINLEINDMKAYVKNIEVAEYIKPTYILNSSFDKVYYKNGEAAKLNVSGTFFDGTPAEGLKLKTSINNEAREITLDNNGNRVVSHIVTKDTKKWHPSYVSAWIMTTGNDEDAETYASACYFPTDYMFEADWKNNNLILKSNKIDFTTIVNENIDYDKIRGSVALATGNVEVIRNEIVKTETGEYYDYINKITKKKYSYNTVKTPIDWFTFATDNGIANIPMNYPKEENVYYTANISYKLADGFEGETSVYRYNYNMYSNDSDYKEYSFSSNKSKYETKDEVFIELKCNYESVTNEGKLLYVVIQDNIKDIAVTKNSDFKLNFTEVYIPNVAVCGAYFDGTRIFPISSEYLYFNTDERELKIKITTDKESYKPGDTVTMTVEAKDKFGKTYPTNLVMSVVDEAAFAIQDQYVNPLSKLYSYKYYYPNQYVSYVQHTDYVTSEGGGEGDGEGYRSDFEDTAEFITITTGSNGKTTASFKLPDNLTSWRITAVGITNNVRAGYNTKNITAGLPFFINQVINEKYTSEDTVTFTARISGTAKNKLTDNVDYTAKITGDNFEKTINLTKTAKEVATFNFGMLNQGEYEVSIKAVSGTYSDGIKKKIYVLDSLHEIMQSKEIDLTKEIDINALKYPVNLMFYNTDNVLYYNNIKKILSKSWGTTNEQKVARNIVYNKLNSLQGETLYSLAEISGLQNYNGGAKLLDYSDTDVLFTAKLCALAPDYIDTISAKNYFEGIINNSSSTPSEVSAAYYGLAALKQPVMNDIKYLLNNNKVFSTRDNINLVSGLACMGDINGANEWYVKLLSKNIKEENGYRYIHIGNSDENYEATSSLIIPLVKMNHSDLTMFMEYVIKASSDKYTPALDLTSYLIEFNPKDSEGYIKYELNGAKQEIGFNGKPVVSLVLNEKSLRTLKITDSKKVNCTAVYMGGITDVVDTAFNKIPVEKTVTGGIRVGDTVTTTIKIKFPSGTTKNTQYILTDVIPSGMRYTGMERAYNSGNYLINQELQKLYFVVSNKDGNEIAITYTSRNLLPGEYLIDSAVVENPKENLKGYSETSSFVIRED